MYKGKAGYTNVCRNAEYLVTYIQISSGRNKIFRIALSRAYIVSSKNKDFFFRASHVKELCDSKSKVGDLSRG